MIFLLLLGGFIEMATALPYIRDIRAGKTQPAIVSWTTWMLLSFIASIASFSAGAIPSAIVTLALTLECFFIVLISIGRGKFSYTRFDKYCQSFALFGLFLWWWSSNPLTVLLCFVAVDAIGALPTFRHAWRRPHEETISTFSLSIIGNAIVLFAAPVFVFSQILAPAYLLSLNTLLTSEILFRRRQAKKYIEVKATS